MRKKPFLRLSLRALLVLLTIFCIWFALYATSVRRQKESVRWIMEHGGEIAYDWDSQATTNPAWLDDYIHTVKGVSLARSEIEDISPLANLDDVEYIVLSGNRISDVTPLSALKNLQGIKLGGNRISDISPLAHLSKLTHLQLDNNQIRDISPLVGLPKLALVSLKGNPVDENQLKSLKEKKGISVSE